MAKVEDLFQKIMDRFDDTDKKNGDGFSNLNQKLTSLSSRVEKVASDQSKTADEVEVLQDEVKQVKEEVGEARATAEKAIDMTEALEKKTEERFLALEQKLGARVSSLPVHVPSFTISEQCSVQSRFEALLEQARVSQNIFAAGHVKDKVPSFGIKKMTEIYFSKANPRCLPKLGSTKVWRFSVDEEKISLTKNIINTQIMAIRDHGWWVQQDVPLPLRQMYSTCFAFFKRVKDLHDNLRKWFLNADDGYVVLDLVPVVPVYLVPKNTDKWVPLAALLNELVAGLVQTEWMDSVKKPIIVPNDFIEKWCDALGVDRLSTSDDKSVGSSTPTNERLLEDVDMDQGGGG
jgi:hypothetical protein